MIRAWLSLTLAGALAAPPQSNRITVVTSLTTYAAIAREVVGDRGTVRAIAEGDEDPHFVQPRPSYAALLRSADLFVTTGMDLELWVPALLDRAGNAQVREGGRGYVAAARDIRVLEVPSDLSRAQGDIHVAGNPHIFTDPINAIVIARNVAAGLGRIAPADTAYFAARLRDFELRILNATYGEDLVRTLTPATLFELAQNGRDVDFLRRTMYQGRPLLERLGGWMRQAQAFRGHDMVCYHKEWAYFSRRFGVRCVEYLEPKPGIPPTPRHVREVIELMRERRIRVLFSANYYDANQIREIAQRTGAAAVTVPENTQGAPGVDTYFDLVNTWITALGRGFEGVDPHP